MIKPEMKGDKPICTVECITHWGRKHTDCHSECTGPGGICVPWLLKENGPDLLEEIEDD